MPRHLNNKQQGRLDKEEENEALERAIECDLTAYANVRGWILGH
jgi:hypothetical protein